MRAPHSAAFVTTFAALLAVASGCGTGQAAPDAGPTAVPSAATCATFTYSSWGTCANGLQTRTVLSAAPDGCTGGSPHVSQSCGSGPTTCTSFTYSAWGTCTNGTQTRTVASSSPAGCTGGSPVLSQSCTPTPGTCTSFTYSAWGTCTNGLQSRTVLTSSPAGCSGGAPMVSQSCGVDTSGGAPGGGGTEYHVGAGQTYTTIGGVPWADLQAGDTVYIHPGTYHEKILVSTSGTPSQWIRVRGVADPSTGALPVISGVNATVPASQHWRTCAQAGCGWDTVEQSMLVGIGPGANTSLPPPQYVEIAGLQIQGANPNNTFTSASGPVWRYIDFAACVYIRAGQHILVRDNVLTDCAQGLYNWTSDGASNTWYGALAADLTIRSNYFHDNGWPNAWTSHQSYTEADGVVIEGNRFGPVKAGAFGNHVKDRSAGTVVRYNFFEEAPENGYFIDLVEPQAGCPSLGYTSCGTDNAGHLIPLISPNAKYQQTFVYGNVFHRTNANTNFLHWNEDHTDVPAKGRAALASGRLFFYANTIVDTGGHDLLFNETNGAYECPAYDLPGRIVFVNNVVYSSKGTYSIGEYCYGRPQVNYAPDYTYDHGNWDFGVSWSSPAWSFFGTASTGTASVLSPAGGPGFTSLSGGDYSLASGSSARNIGAALPAAVTSSASNYLGLDLTPTKQYVYPHATPTPRMTARSVASGAGSDLGAFQH